MIKKRYSIASCLGVLLFASCTSNYYSKEDFATVKKIDTHTHLNCANTALAEQAKQDNFKLLAINVDVPEDPALEVQLSSAKAQQSKYPAQIDFVTAFTLANWNSPQWTSQTIAKLKAEFAQGALGIKIWKSIGMVYKDSNNHFIMIDNPRFDSVINYVIQQDKTVLGHLGEPKNCWLPLDSMTVNSDKSYYSQHPQYHMYLHPEYPSYQQQITARDNFIERHPNMRFVGAHLGSLEWSVDELAKRLDKYPNMAVDMAERICHLQYQSQKNKQKVRDFMIKYQDRLLYGTDKWIDTTITNTDSLKAATHNTWLKDWQYFVTDDTMTNDTVNGSFTGLKLPKTVVDKIFYSNAVHWFKIKE